MTHYIAQGRGLLLRRVVPRCAGRVTGGDTLDEAIAQATEFMVFAAGDQVPLTGKPLPPLPVIAGLDPAIQPLRRRRA